MTSIAQSNPSIIVPSVNEMWFYSIHTYLLYFLFQVVRYTAQGHYHAHYDSETHTRTDAPCCHQVEDISKIFNFKHPCRLCRYVVRNSVCAHFFLSMGTRILEFAKFCQPGFRSPPFLNPIFFMEGLFLVDNRQYHDFQNITCSFLIGCPHCFHCHALIETTVATGNRLSTNISSLVCNTQQNLH